LLKSINLASSDLATHLAFYIVCVLPPEENSDLEGEEDLRTS